MEGDEMEMTKEELQRFIQDSVNRRLLHTPEVMSKQSQLLLLWDRKEKLYTDLYKLFESVSKCEVTVRQLYATIGWEYKALDTEDCNGSASDYGGTREDADSEGCASPASSGITAACSYDEQAEIMTEEKWERLGPRKELRVLLTRLPMHVRPRRSVPRKLSRLELSDDELSNADSDYQPSPPPSDSDSDFSISSGQSDRRKKKRLRKTETFAQKTPVQQATPVQQQAASFQPTTTSQPTTSVQPTPTAQSTITVQPVNIKSTNSGKPLANTNGIPEVKKEAKPYAVTDEIRPANGLPNVPKEAHVGMEVLARRKRLRWESGKIAEIIEKEDGTMKYKVTFEDKGKVLVSGHHIAYDAVPKLVHLSVGGRVLSKCKSEHKFYSPGILAELPSRKNHMRFLIFFDDHQALYVALPVIRVICKPLSNALDDIRDEEHKTFMKDYLQRMPYPPQTQFRVGQGINVMRDGVLETCTVLQLDSSLMEIVFTKDDLKEWIYRGSLRLEHIIKARQSPQNN